MRKLVQTRLWVWNADRAQHFRRMCAFLIHRRCGTMLDVQHLPPDRQDRVMRLHRILKDD